jgi:hypothetical protein
VGAAAQAAVVSEAADAEASSLEAVEVVAAEAVEAAGELAWYGHLCGPGAAGVSPHLLKRYLMSRRSYRHKQLRLQKELTHPHELNSVRHRRQQLRQLRNVGCDPPRLVFREQRSR